MTTDVHDEVDEVFACARHDENTQQMLERWQNLVAMRWVIGAAAKTSNGSLIELAEKAKSEILRDRTVIPMTPREYERLLSSVERLRFALEEFDDMWCSLEVWSVDPE